MSNETLVRNIIEVLSEHGVYPDAEDDAFELRSDIRCEIDGHLAAQAEWPSEEDVELVCKGIFKAWPNVFEARRIREDARAALQSVRRPVGVVSDDYKEIARLIGSIFFFGDFKAETHNERELEKLLRKTGNFYDTQEQFDDASRHEPTKDGLLISRFLWCECCKAVTEHEKRDPDVCCKECHSIAVSEHHAPTKD